MKRATRPQQRRARLLRALGHPVRLQIAEILAREEACVCHLEARLGLRQAYVSQQLAVLRKAGLLAERRVGTFVYHRLSNRRLAGLLKAVREAVGDPPAELGPLPPGKCGCPRCELGLPVTG